MSHAYTPVDMPMESKASDQDRANTSSAHPISEEPITGETSSNKHSGGHKDSGSPINRKKKHVVTATDTVVVMGDSTANESMNTSHRQPGKNRKDKRVHKHRDSATSTGDKTSQPIVDGGEDIFDKARNAVKFQQAIQKDKHPDESAESYYRLELNLSKGAGTMRDPDGNVVYGEPDREPVEAAPSSGGPVTPVRQHKAPGPISIKGNGRLAEGNAFTDTDRGGLLPIRRSTSTPTSVDYPESLRDINSATFSEDTVTRNLPDDIQKKFIAQLDLRLTDYFMHVRCMCSYTMYTLHFNDFGVHKVVSRRFSEFWYYDKVLSEIKYKAPIPLPPKRFWDNTSPSFLSQRFQGLKNYFLQQVQHPSNSHLYLLHMFLGCNVESILYLHLVTAQTGAEKMNAVSILFKYLMKTREQKDEFLSDIVMPPLTNFKHWSPAKIEPDDRANVDSDYRLASPLVMESLLDCLVFSDYKTVAEVCAIFLYMLHHEEHIRRSALSAKAINYVTKAISRLLLRKNMVDFEFPFPQFRDPLTDGMLDDMITRENQSAWGVASYFLVMALNLLPEAARTYLSNRSSLDKLCNLLEYNDYDVLRRFCSWLLWIASFQDDLKTLVDREAVTSLLKKLYGSEDTTIKVMCGLVIVSLIASGWFDSDSEPRALASVLKLLDSIYDLDIFISQQILSNWSISRFGDLLSNRSLSVGARLFLVSVLNHHLMLDFETVHKEINISKLCEVDYRNNLSQVTHELFGAVDPDYRSDMDMNSDITFTEKFTSLYLHKFRPLSIALYEILYEIGESTWGNHQATTVKEDETYDDVALLSYNTAMCLLLLPYDSPKNTESDYFDVDFNPMSRAVHFRNLVHLKGEMLRLQIDPVHLINLEDTVALRLDKKFFTRRVATLRVMLSRMQESLTEFNDIHLSNNEMANECMSLLRRCWSSKEVVEHSDSPNVVVTFDARRNEQVDLFNNFEFPGLESPVFDFYSTFKSVDTFEMCQYVNHMLKYSSIQQRLLKLVRFSILYHQACEARLSTYKSMVASLESRLKDIKISTIDDLVDMEERFLVDSRAYNVGLQEEGDIVSKLHEKNLMLSRVSNMLKSTNAKLGACRRQVSSIQKRIDDIPRLRNDSMASRNQLSLLAKGLEDSIRSGNEKILQLQVKVAQDEKLKQDYSECINQVTHFSSALDIGSLSAILDAVNDINSEDLRLEMRQLVDSILSERVNVDDLDAETVFNLKSAVLSHLNSVQDKLNLLYSSDANHQIAMLNRKVQQDEERLYRAQVELQNANKSMVVDDGVLQDSLSTHKLMLTNLESTSSNLESEIAKINDVNRELDKQLAKVKSSNDFIRTRLENTRFAFIEGIKEQRQIRLESFRRLLAAEFMCKKICQERTKLSLVFEQKGKLMDIIRQGSDQEKEARKSLVESFKVASKRLQETAEFLEGSDPPGRNAA